MIKEFGQVEYDTDGVTYDNRRSSDELLAMDVVKRITDATDEAATIKNHHIKGDIYSLSLAYIHKKLLP